MRHRQTCACGADISLRAKDSAAIEPAITRWEARHATCSPKPPEPQKEGATCQEIGFHPQPDHDGRRTCGVTA